MANGAWEIAEQRKVLCAILHTDVTTVAWSLGLRNLMIPGSIMPIAGMPYDHARNTAVEACLAHGFQYVFFLDSDVIPPRDTIHRLLAHKKPIVSGVYCRRSPPATVPVAIKNGTWVTKLNPNALMEVDLVGAGCLLIHRSVFESLPHSDAARGKKWFDWRVDMKDVPGVQPGSALSEDFQFCLNAKNFGYQILLDTSIQCKHVGYNQVTYGTMAPLDANPNT